MLGTEKPPCLCPVIGLILLLLGDCHFREERKYKLNAWSKWQVYITWQMYAPNVECTCRTIEK